MFWTSTLHSESVVSVITAEYIWVSMLFVLRTSLKSNPSNLLQSVVFPTPSCPTPMMRIWRRISDDWDNCSRNSLTSSSVIAFPKISLKIKWINATRILHGEEHVKKLFSTAVIVNEDTHSNLVHGHCFTGEDTNTFHPWSLKLEGFFRKSTNISFYMVTNLFIYTTGNSHIIDDCNRAVSFGQSLIGL